MLDGYIYATPLNGGLRVVCRSLSRQDVQVQAIAQIPPDAYPLVCTVLRQDTEVSAAVVCNCQGLVDFLAAAAQTQSSDCAPPSAGDGDQASSTPGDSQCLCAADAQPDQPRIDGTAVTISALTCLAGIGIFSIGYLIARA